jgi:hypothetical protein
MGVAERALPHAVDKRSAVRLFRLRSKICAAAGQLLN